MSWTPDFLIRKKELDEVLEKNSQYTNSATLKIYILEEYPKRTKSGIPKTLSTIENKMKVELEKIKGEIPKQLLTKELDMILKSRLLDSEKYQKLMAKKCKLLLEKESESKELFEKDNILYELFKREFVPSSNVAYVYQIENKEYYHISTEFTLEADTLKDFCDKHKLTYVTLD